MAALHCIYVLWFMCSLTTTGTESIFLILVKVACGGTPAVTITAALCGTAVILLPQKGERENTWSSTSISIKSV